MKKEYIINDSCKIKLPNSLVSDDTNYIFVIKASALKDNEDILYNELCGNNMLYKLMPDAFVELSIEQILNCSIVPKYIKDKLLFTMDINTLVDIIMEPEFSTINNNILNIVDDGNGTIIFNTCDDSLKEIE